MKGRFPNPVWIRIMALGLGVAAGVFGMGGGAMALSLRSTAFSEGSEIPRKHTCDGPDLSPELLWDEPPAGTQSLCLIADDPDAPAGTWVHWVYFDIPVQARSLPEGLSKNAELKDGSRQGRNDFGRVGYGGPCPPRGPAHRYFFKLYALNAKLDLPPGSTKADVERAMKGKILGQAQLMGKYKR